MKVIKADHERRLMIPGVPGVAQRPVDIDSSKTGFTRLRSLRIYRFEAETAINGHAEEDEVLVVVLSGSIELTISLGDSEDAGSTFLLSAPGSSDNDAFVAYLPPRSSYRLVPRTEADIAYARAVPGDSRRDQAVFRPNKAVTGAEVNVLLYEHTHAERLRLRVLHIDAKKGNVIAPLLDAADVLGEALAYLQCSPAACGATIAAFDGGSLPLDSWDTVALSQGDGPVLHVAQGAIVWVMTVFAA